MINRSKLGPTTSESDDNTEALAKQECLRLTKHLRLMENDKKAYFEESKAALELQKKIINSVEKENSEITEELQIKNEEHLQSKQNKEEIQSILQKLDKLGIQLKAENRLVSEEYKKVTAIKHRLEKLEKEFDSNEDLNEKEPFLIAKLQSKLFQMKKKLETVTGQFDALVASNGKARTRIDELLDENISVSRKLSQLESELADKKNLSFQLVQDATGAYDQREEAASKMNGLSERSLKEKRQFTIEMGELTRVIRNEEKFLNFLSTKNKDRTFLETDEERISRVELAKEQVLDQTLESYRENFETLLTSKSPTFVSLLNEYTELHHSNVRQFAQINELTTEIENLQNDAIKYRQEIRQYSSETVQVNITRKKEIEDKQKEFEQLEVEYHTVGTEYQKIDNVLLSIVKLIEEIFLATDQTEVVSVLELVGSQAEINSENIVLYASILEQRIKSILKPAVLYENAHLLNGINPNIPLPLSPAAPIAHQVSNKALSDIVPNTTNRPRILISHKASSEHGFSSDELHYDLIQTEMNPLTYADMKHKILDAASLSSRIGSARSSVISGDI